MKNGAGLTRGANIFSVSTALIATVIGFYFYHEKLNNFQLAGVMLGIVSLYLIFYES
jgi:drug/metabolite transporter (DMT)-like permease